MCNKNIIAANNGKMPIVGSETETTGNAPVDVRVYGCRTRTP